MRNLVYPVVGVILLCSATASEARLAANRLSANHLAAVSAAANSTAASKLAASKLAVSQTGPNEYALNLESAADLLATPDGAEVLAFIVSCALPEGTTLVTALPAYPDFFGELGLANEWLDHPLRESGRGWISACLYARVNAHDVAIPFSMRGAHPSLATTPEELAAYDLEEGAFYGDFFAAPGETFSWIACRGQEQSFEEIAGLIDRDCAEPDPADPAHTHCGFSYAGDCGEFASSFACKHFSPHEFYRSCNDQPTKASGAKVFKEVITVYALGF